MLISRRTLRRLTAFVSVLLGFAGTLALGSVNGRISGTVKDPAGAVVPEAAVTAINTETGARQTIPTDPQGVYSFPSLPVGHYDLEIRKQGFKEHQETGLTLDVNTALRVDVSLELGAASQQVTVQALAVQVETTNTQMGEVISDTKMTTVPLNGRSYTDLLALQPGVVPVSSGQYNALSVSGNLNPGSLSVNGQRESANGFMVNGGNVEEATFGATAIIPNLDSIAEFRILRSMPSPNPAQINSTVMPSSSCEILTWMRATSSARTGANLSRTSSAPRLEGQLSKTSYSSSLTIRAPGRFLERVRATSRCLQRLTARAISPTWPANSREA
jgi:hypothetical protein